MGALPRLSKNAGYGATQNWIAPARRDATAAASIATSGAAFPKSWGGASRLIMFTLFIYLDYSVDSVYVILYKITVFRTLPCSPARQVKSSGVLSDVFVE
jgi:hypothetical protein